MSKRSICVLRAELRNQCLIQFCILISFGSRPFRLQLLSKCCLNEWTCRCPCYLCAHATLPSKEGCTHTGPGVEGARSIGGPKGRPGCCRHGGGGQRVDTLREMSQTRSYRAFSTLLRNGEFKPPFQMKHFECSNGPLKILSWNCLRAAIILKTVFMWQLLPRALCFVITRLANSCQFLLELCLPNLVRLVCRRMGFDMINGPWKREEKAYNTHFHSIQE